MALYLIVVQAHFVMNNLFEGLIWFFLPASLVITNDIFAYICGMAFGRTQLIELSPKKTVEGFVGAWICTIIFGFGVTNVLIRYKYFICPVNVRCLVSYSQIHITRLSQRKLICKQDLGANIFTGLECTPNPVFIAQAYNVPSMLSNLSLPGGLAIPSTVLIAPMQFHILVFATFASLIAPFGGFFASGLKRTFKVKDFGESIPGHGGITDRMDCQFIMGFFTFVYYQSFIAIYKATVGDVMERAVQGLEPEEIVEVVRGLSKYLVNQGVVEDRLLNCLTDVVGKRR